MTQLKKAPEGLRNFFFELFIYQCLDAKHIPNIKKPIINNQELEGICVLNGEQYLFECRKAFLPNIEVIDILRRLMQYVTIQVRTY